MTFGTPEIIICPSCGMHQLRRTMASGNNIGIRYYSDGNCVAPMLLEVPYFVKCPSCGVFFKIIDEVIDEKMYDENPSDPFVEFLTADEYIQAIAEGLYNTGKSGSKEQKNDILALRISFWRFLNQSDRDEYPAAYEENCRQILSEFTNDADEPRLTRADLCRNLGEFDKCKSVLSEIKETEKYGVYIDAIRAACDAENTLTVQVN